MKILIITKSRSGYGAHVVLTALIRQLRTMHHRVDVMVSEHPLEYKKWASHTHLWEGINAKVVEFTGSTITDHDPAYGPYAYTDDILLHDVNLVHMLYALPTDHYDLVLLDSWYLMYSAFLSGIHLRENVYQFVQSEPVFQPAPDEEWKAAIFSLMPWVKARRIFVSPSLAHKFNREYHQSHGAIGFFLNQAFLNTAHCPRVVGAGEPLKIASMASNFNIPSKGLPDLMSVLRKVHKRHPIMVELISKYTY